MIWKKVNPRLLASEYLKQGTIARTKSGEFVIVGEINTAAGTNDEYMEELTHYTNNFVPVITDLLKAVETSFNNNIVKTGLCSTCFVNHSEPPHTCPHREDVHNDKEFRCDCCDECKRSCREDI